MTHAIRWRCCSAAAPPAARPSPSPSVRSASDLVLHGQICGSFGQQQTMSFSGFSGTRVQHQTVQWRRAGAGWRRRRQARSPPGHRRCKGPDTRGCAVARAVRRRTALGRRAVKLGAPQPLRGLGHHDSCADWGWNGKFMELSKVLDGFTTATDTLVIKAQVRISLSYGFSWAGATCGFRPARHSARGRLRRNDALFREDGRWRRVVIVCGSGVEHRSVGLPA